VEEPVLASVRGVAGILDVRVVELPDL